MPYFVGRMTLVAAGIATGATPAASAMLLPGSIVDQFTKPRIAWVRCGVEIDDDASDDELVQATNGLLMSVLDSSGGPAGPDCMEETGFAEAWRG